MNYKNFKRYVNSQKCSRFSLPCTALICTSYEEFKLTVAGLQNFYISANQREENKDERTRRMDRVSELDYVMDITERLEKV